MAAPAGRWHPARMAACFAAFVVLCWAGQALGNGHAHDEPPRIDFTLTHGMLLVLGNGRELDELPRIGLAPRDGMPPVLGNGRGHDEPPRIDFTLTHGMRLALGNGHVHDEPPRIDLALRDGTLPVPGNGHAHDEPLRIDLALRDGIRLALRNNHDLVNAQLDRVAERFSLRVAENAFRPHVTIGPYVDRAHTERSTRVTAAGVSSKVVLRIPTGGEFGFEWRGAGEHGRATPPSPRYFNALDFTFTQPLLRGAGIGTNTASVRLARLAEEINVLALRQTVIDVISSVVRSYHRYMQAQRRVEIDAQSLKRARDILAVNNLLVQAGRMAERDIVQARAGIARRELALIAAQNALDAARLALIDLLDIDSRTRLRLTDSLDARPAQRTRADAARSVGVALRHRPDYLSALLGVRDAETRAMVAGNDRLWDLSVTLSAKFAQAGEAIGATVGGLDGTDYGIRLHLDIPIGAGAADPAELAHVQAMTELGKSRNDLADLRRRIDIEVGNAVREVELSARQIELARAARQLVEQKTDIEREKLRLGLSSNFQLAAFEDELVAARNSELDATISHLDATTALDRALGTTLDTWGIDIDQVGRANDSGAVSR